MSQPSVRTGVPGPRSPGDLIAATLSRTPMAGLIGSISRGEPDPPTVPAIHRLTDEQLMAAEVVVVASGPYPGPDAVAVAREISTRLEDDRPGRVVVLAHAPVRWHAELLASDEMSVPIPAHWAGPLLRGWAARGLDRPAAHAELVSLRAHLDRSFGVGALHGSGALMATGAVALLSRGRIAVEAPGPPAESHVLSPHRIVLATGAGPRVPDVPGILETDWYTASDLFDLPALPASVVIVGAGSHGCEVAQGLVRLGVTVTLVDSAERPLPDLPDRAAEPVIRALAAEGVRMICGAPLAKVAPTLDGGAWVGTDGGGDVAAEALILATGRRPRTTGMDLPAGGVTVSGRGVIEVDERLRTATSTVLACGEVTGMTVYGAAPGPMARVVAANVVGRRSGMRWTAPVPALVTRTDPEVVALGQCEPQPGDAVAEAEGPHPDSSVRVVVGTTGGRGVFSVLAPLGGGTGRSVVGALLRGPGASEAVGQLVLALNAGIPAASLLDVEAPDGTWAAAVQGCIARALAG